MPETSADLLRRAAATVRGNNPAIRVVARSEFADGDDELGELIAAWLESDASQLAHAVSLSACDEPGAVERSLDLARAILGEPA